MKFICEPKVKKPAIKLPEVGECWRHKSLPESVWMRIEDSNGEAVCSNHRDVFYSVNLKQGYITWTDKSSLDIEMLDSNCVFTPKA